MEVKQHLEDQKTIIEARKVCDNFDLTYHLATAVTYLLRAYQKHESPVEDITKAISHLEFELEKIKRGEQQCLPKL